jgi:serine/threonine protein kinase/WD40 repeat protein
MNSPTPSREEEIFTAVVALPAAEWAAYLEKACGGDEALRRRVEELLRSHGESDGFLQQPLNAEMARVVAQLAPTQEHLGQTIGRYKLLQKIGEGGCGIVYLAEQQEPVRRRVALKVIKLGMDTKEVIARFEAERQALALMDHPNIARVFDAGATDTGRPFFVMELVRGEPITKYCDEQNLATAKRLELFTKICHAVQHAHQKGIIHRDLKPSNILVTLHDGVPVPKVIDFGVAKATQGRLTDATLFTGFEQFIGTPAYTSPEQAELSGLDIDTRSDIYSLGVLLYELLTGRPPFDPKSLVKAGLDEIRRIIREVEPPRPSTRLSTLTDVERAMIAKTRNILPAQLSTLLRGDLDWIVMRCLEKDRTRRYETANGLALDVLRHLHDEPVVARPPSGFYRLRKTARRNKAAFVAGGAILAALIGGLVIATWQYLEKSEAHRRAVTAEQTQLELRERAEQASAREAEQRKAAEKSASRATEQEAHARRLLYAADMNLAQQALQGSNLGQARRLLERHRPKPGEVDLRGWEWRYLWQQCRSGALVSLTQHPGRVGSLSFSSNSRRLAIGRWDGRTELWDVRGRKLEAVLRAAGEYSVVRFSPQGDMLAYSGERGELILRDVASGAISATYAPAAGSVLKLSFSQNGNYLACIGSSGMQVLDLVRKQTLFTRLDDGYGGRPQFGGIRFSSDGSRVFVSRTIGDTELSVAVFRIPEGTLEREFAVGTDNGVSAMAASPDGRFLVTATGWIRDNIRVWNTSTLASVAELRTHVGWVGEVAFAPDGSVLASASADQTVRLWDTTTWSERAVLRGHNNEINSVALSPDGQLIASGDKSGEVLLWSATQPPSAGSQSVFPEQIANAALLPGESAVLTVSAKGVISRWEVPAMREATLAAPSDKIQYFWPPNYFGTETSGSSVRVHAVRGSSIVNVGDVDVGQKATAVRFDPERQELSWRDSTGRSQRASVGPGNRAHAAAANDTLPLMRLEGGDVVFRRALAPHELLAKHPLPGPANVVEFSPDRKVVAVATNNGLIALYDRTTQRHRLTLQGHLQSANGVVFTPDGLRLFSIGGGRETAKLWDTTTGQELLDLRGPRGGMVFAYCSDDGSTFLVGLENRHWQVWHAPSWKEIEALERSAPITQAIARVSAPVPSPSPVGKRGIYLVTLEPGSATIKGPATPLTDRFAESNCAPSWSPDGKAIAFKRSRPAAAGEQKAVYDWIVHDVVTGMEKSYSLDIPDAGCWSGPLWYPDGRHLLAKSFMEVSAPKNFRINLDAGELTPIAMPALKPAVVISPDGKTLYSTTQDTGAKTTGIVAIDLATGASTPRWRSPYLYYHLVPVRLVVSPDGRTLAAILADGPNESHLVRVNTDGTDYRVLYSARGDLAGGSALSRSGLAWTDQGRALLFMDGNNSGQRLLRISADGGEPAFTGLMMGDADVIFDVSPDGTRLALSPGAPIISTTAAR